METGESPRTNPPARVPVDAPPTRDISLACLQGAKGFFSGEAIQHKLLCTASHNTACQIIHHLSAWNEMLSQAGVELREQPRTRARLTVASIDINQVIDLGEEELHRAVTLLHLLLKKHRCITSLQLVPERLNAYDALLYKGILDNENIESLKLVSGNLSRTEFESVFSVIPSLRNLREFECMISKEFDQPCTNHLMELLWTTSTLESLHLHSHNNSPVGSTSLLKALASCFTLRHLSLEFKDVQSASIESCEEFAEYLRNTKILISLSFTGWSSFNSDSSKVVLRALCANRSILKLHLGKVYINNQEDEEIIALIFSENDMLRSIYIDPQFMCIHNLYFDSWLYALAGNDTLEELTLPFDIWLPFQWTEFFAMLSTKHSLQSVTIGSPYNGPKFRELCRSLLDNGVDGKVTLAPAFNTFVYNENEFSPIGCKSFRDVNARLIDDKTGRSQLKRLLRELTPLSHVRQLTLCVALSVRDQDIFSSLADYIAATTSLKKLRLDFRFYYPLAPVVSEAKTSFAPIFDSLSKNRSIAELTIDTDLMEDEDVKLLSVVIRCSENIRTFAIWNEDSNVSAAVMRHLSRGIVNNHSLLSVPLCAPLDRHMFAVQDTARRNSGLVARATHFRRGTQLDRFTAAALERVSRHRALLTEFAELESITVDEAAAALRPALKNFEDMHGFMRMAGVVRSAVRCYPRRDGRMQLDELNEHCWMALRHYIMLDDVVMHVPHV